MVDLLLLGSTAVVVRAATGSRKSHGQGMGRSGARGKENERNRLEPGTDSIDYNGRARYSACLRFAGRREEDTRDFVFMHTPEARIEAQQGCQRPVCRGNDNPGADQ